MFFLSSHGYAVKTKTMANSFWVMVVIQVVFVATYFAARFFYRIYSRIQEAKRKTKILSERVSKLGKK